MTMPSKVWLCCHVKIESELCLQDLGRLLSKNIFGGIGFRESRAHDEIPLIVLEQHVFGLKFEVDGKNGKFSLAACPVTWEGEVGKYMAEKNQIEDISPYLVEVLTKIQGISSASPLGI